MRPSAPGGRGSSDPATVAYSPPQSSTRSKVALLIGDKRRLVAGLAAASVVSGFTEATTLAIVAQVAAALVGGSHRVHATVGALGVHATVGRLILIGLILTLIRLVLQWPLSVLPARIASGVGAAARRKVFRAFTEASWDVQSRDREGQLQEVMTSQTNQAVTGAIFATSLITAVLTFVILMVTAIALNAGAAGVVFGVAVLMFVVLRPLRSLGARYSRATSQAQLEFAGGIAEANRLAEETQVFGVMDKQFDRVGELVETVRGYMFRAQIVAKLVPNLYQSLIYVFLIGGLAALNAVGKGHAGSLGAVILLLVRAAQQGQGVQAFYQALQQSLPFIERLQDTERRYGESRVSDGGEPLEEVRSVEFNQVSFAYNPGRPVLSSVSFRVEAGEAIGVIGPSGAGKSTLVQILLRLRAPISGAYLVNGEPVERFSRDDWQKVVAYVPQSPRLLHATVADNIRFFRQLSEDEVVRAGKLARIHDEIMSWSDGYDTIVGPRADAVSGGQQQRICLARALVARPRVLVLDEPTSALDPHSETVIQESLSALKSELTLFTIAHRMSTLDMCDRVMVILDGHLAAFDTKAVLQRENHYYRSASTIAARAQAGMLPEAPV
jgi:ABC-type multidrug transport system fused ATPase/permease subunit